MSLALNGSTGYLVHGARIANSFPFTMTIWVAGSTAVSNQVAIMQGQSNGDRAAMGWFTNFGANKEAYLRNPGVNNAAQKATTPNLNAATMQLMMVIFESLTSRKVYFGSNVESTNAAAMLDDISNHDRVTIGAYWINSAGAPSIWLNGSVAEAHFYSRALDDTDYDSLAAGALGETRANWIDGFPMRDTTDLVSVGGGRSLTLVGGVTNSGIAHPVTRSGGGGSGMKNALNFFYNKGNQNV